MKHPIGPHFLSEGPHRLLSYYVRIANEPQAVLTCDECGTLFGERGLDFMAAWQAHLDAKRPDVDDATMTATADSLLALRRRAGDRPRTRVVPPG